MRKIKNILILAGGDSTRFWPLSDKKNTVFLGEKLIDYQINFYKKWVENIFVISDTNQSIYSKSAKYIIQDEKLSGQAGAILSAKNIIKGEVLIVNTNDVFEPSILPKLIDSLSKKPNFVSLMKKVDCYFPGGYIKQINKKKFEIIEKPAPGQTPSDLVKMVVDYIVDFDLFINILEKSNNKNDQWYESGLNELISQSDNNELLVYEGPWYSLKYAWQILEMMNFFLKQIDGLQIHKTAKVAKTSLIQGNVYLGKNVRVGDYTKIVGPCFVDEGTVIGDYSLIRESHVGKNCLIGSQCELVRSYLANDVCLHRNYVGDSVLSKGVLIGAGTVLANFRFDKKNVSVQLGEIKIDTHLSKFGVVIGEKSKLGVNCSVFPGVLIGKNTIIGPGSLIDKNVKEDQFVFRDKVIKKK